jgi:hypothetical protein
MSNSALNDALKKCRANQTFWVSSVLVQRTTANQEIAPYVANGADAIATALASFVTRLETLAGKPRVSSTLPVSQLQLIAMHAQFINGALQHYGNGLAWVLQNTSILSSISAVDQTIRSMTVAGVKEQDALLDAAQNRLSQEIKTVQDGAEYLASLLERRDDIEETLEKIDEVESKLDETAKTTTDAGISAAKSIADASDEIETAKAALLEKIDEQKTSLASSIDTVAAIDQLQKSAADTAAAAQVSLDASRDNLVLATTAQSDAAARLKAALSDVQREGLAGAFTQKAAAILKQVETQQKIFGGAVFYLAVVAAIPLFFELFTDKSPTTEQFALRFIRTVALAAPGIWIGWNATRKLSALNRILADYEYKSATALAYESYRKEVDDAGNDSLRDKLLATAIENFGTNPTRHYESAKAEPAAPAEAVAEKLIDRVSSIIGKKSGPEAK